MDEAAGTGGLVERRVVRVSRGVGFRASGASIVARLSERRRRVRRDREQAAASGADMTLT
eukprot:1490498-Pleurochrysis_carterae.AAC.2